MVRRHLRLPRKRWLPREQQVQTSQAGSTCPVAESEGRGGGGQAEEEGGEEGKRPLGHSVHYHVK